VFVVPLEHAAASIRMASDATRAGDTKEPNRRIDLVERSRLIKSPSGKRKNVQRACERRDPSRKTQFCGDYRIGTAVTTGRAKLDFHKFRRRLPFTVSTHPHSAPPALVLRYGKR
jgi:hypothetical protein